MSSKADTSGEENVNQSFFKNKRRLINNEADASISRMLESVLLRARI